MRSWDFVSRRRNLSLEHFLDGASNLEEAYEKFKSFDCVPPKASILEDFFRKKEKSPPPQPQVVEEKKHEKPTKNQQGNKKYDDIIIIETGETSSDD